MSSFVKSGTYFRHLTEIAKRIEIGSITANAEKWLEKDIKIQWKTEKMKREAK